MRQQKSTKSGFTIVELLIVVVVIAILAALTLAAFNGIQGRARNSAAQISANGMVKKLHAYYALSGGSYPSVTTTVITTLGTYKESTIDNSSILVGTPSSSNGTNTLKVELCGSGAGVKITPFDFLTGALSGTVITIGTVTGGCTTATA